MESEKLSNKELANKIAELNNEQLKIRSSIADLEEDIEEAELDIYDLKKQIETFEIILEHKELDLEANVDELKKLCNVLYSRHTPLYSHLELEAAGQLVMDV